jgi:hypothetical protein
MDLLWCLGTKASYEAVYLVRSQSIGTSNVTTLTVKLCTAVASADPRAVAETEPKLLCGVSI